MSNSLHIGLGMMIFLIALALIFDFMNGFHDSANSIATVVSTGVLKPQHAVIMAATFNFIAFYVLPHKVAATIGKGIVQALLKEGEAMDVKKVFTLTYQKPFFESVGFSEIPKESLPSHKIWADCIKCKHFPVCDEIALIKII